MGEWRAVNVGRRSDLLRQFEPPLHLLDVLDLAGIHERHDRAASACSGRAAGTVDVGGVLIDRVEVNHTLDCVDMNASGGNIGGDQCRCLAPGEVVEGSLSLILRPVAMDRHRRHAGPGELAGSTVGAMTSSGEHDRATEGGDDRCTERNAFRAGKLPEVVGHLVEIGGGFTDLVTHGIGLVGLRELGDLAVERRRIQHGLWVVAGLIEQSLHRRHESHVGHAVGLVDDDVFDLGERHDPLLDQILESAGRCDEHVDSAGESVDLGLKADAAVDGESVTPDSGEHRREFVMDLAGEFAGRCKNQDSGAFLVGRAAFERHRNRRNAERQRLSRSGRGPADDVAPVHEIGDGLGLDGERLRDAGGAQHLDDGRRDTELGERRRAGHPPTVPAGSVGVADTHRGAARRVSPRRCLGRDAWRHCSCSSAHRSAPGRRGTGDRGGRRSWRRRPLHGSCRGWCRCGSRRR